jgi:hypothetical protein
VPASDAVWIMLKEVMPEGANAGPCQPGRYSGSSRPVPAMGLSLYEGQASDICGFAADTALADRHSELLPVPYFHVVFTVPAPIAEIALHNKAVV